MSRTEKPVDSIVDPRFANELSYARQIWLRTQHYYVSVLGMRVPTVVVLRDGAAKAATMPRDEAEQWCARINSLYVDGVRELANPEPGAVTRAFDLFRRVGQEFHSKQALSVLVL